MTRARLAATALMALVLSACVPVGDHFPAIRAVIKNLTDQPVVVVISADNVRIRETPRPEVRAYVVQPGEQGWTHSVLLRAKAGWLSVYAKDCALVGREELAEGPYEATVNADATLEVTSLEESSSDQKLPMVQTPDSCGWAAGLWAIPESPRPTDGLVPSGDVQAQQLAALTTLGLDVAPGIELRAPATLRWLPRFTVIETIAVRNGTDRTIAIANELTVLQWNGAKWVRERCIYEQGDDLPDQRICGGALDMEIAAGEEYGGGPYEASPFFDWPGREAEPGTYALVVPVGEVSGPVRRPSTGACVIVTVTANP